MKNENSLTKKKVYLFYVWKQYMKIRKATKKDLDALVELSDQLMLDHKKRFGYRLAKDFHAPKVK